ncbi:MAG TPA: nitrous oxide reductase family maturation protein NosD [Flavobacteriaceae bacterium]|nr:nitrous oxide reductase family maturation protein NosD [Flavobacteriaceae bacterium]
MKYIFILLILTSFFSHATTIEVCASCEVKKIGDATLMAKDGDIIYVKKGVYYETEIQVSNAIQIIGIDNPIIDAQGKQKSVFACKADGFTISGITIKNIGLSYTKEIAGIYVTKSRNFRLKNNTLTNVYGGFVIQRSLYGVISENKIVGTAKDETKAGNGIHLYKCKNMRIEKNEIIGMRDGIYLEIVHKSSISNNINDNNIRYGLHFMFSNHNEFHHNQFRDNGSGCAVMYSDNINMHHNSFRDNWGMASYGLLLKEINDSVIESNLFEKNTIGINIDSCNRNKYKSNHLYNNGWAIKFQGASTYNFFQFNNFVNNSFDLSFKSSLKNNKFEANHWSEYRGYDLDKDGIGDVPHRPLKLFSFITTNTPDSVVLLRSLFVDIINFSEQVSPIFTPENLVDKKPIIKVIDAQY